MAQSKLHLFDQTSIQFAELCKALAHPARIAILKTLAKRVDNPKYKLHNRGCCGYSSAVERHLAKVNVARSNRVTRFF